VSKYGFLLCLGTTGSSTWFISCCCCGVFLFLYIKTAGSNLRRDPEMIDAIQGFLGSCRVWLHYQHCDRELQVTESPPRRSWDSKADGRPEHYFQYALLSCCCIVFHYRVSKFQFDCTRQKAALIGFFLLHQNFRHSPVQRPKDERRISRFLRLVTCVVSLPKL
jgi:hypothetical protein